ncbi:MAG: hypothetical protein MK096_13395 [Oleiphilaceae bacterium]|jgi:hypothetical protein|nr:hypothetical protein [Oleiphilaceae bacterium]
MRREFIAITLAYLVGIGSFIAQWQAEYTQPLKGLQVLAVSLCVALCVYSMNVAKNKKAAMVGLPSIVLAGWGGFKFIFFVVAITLPVLIGGHAP